MLSPHFWPYADSDIVVINLDGYEEEDEDYDNTYNNLYNDYNNTYYEDDEDDYSKDNEEDDQVDDQVDSSLWDCYYSAPAGSKSSILYPCSSNLLQSPTITSASFGSRISLSRRRPVGENCLRQCLLGRRCMLGGRCMLVALSTSTHPMKTTKIVR